MALQHSGRIMVRVPRQQFTALSALWSGRTLFGPGAIRPLFASSYAAGLALDAHHPPEHQSDWLIQQSTPDDRHPWDIAHEVAEGKAPGNAHFAASPSAYAEPDILHTRNYPERPKAVRAAAAQPQAAPYPPAEGLNTHYDPTGNTFSPAWHLEKEHANFVGAWTYNMGKGIRIAHLDTGYYPAHESKPIGMLPDQGYNFYENNRNTVDPGLAHVWEMPGHGTATLALLAGNKINVRYETGPAYSGYIGGAPEASIIPVRIGPSVVHLYTADLAKGLDHALSPMGAERCDVVSLSHGGLPSTVWGAAVNRLYEAGVVVVAAAGDSFNLKIMDIATHFTVYPSAFYRVITATGATYSKGPYKAKDFGVMQGCWGPEKVMKKAVAAYTPNVPWMKFKTEHEWDMDGGGTSASTPQVAAACALWLAQYGNQFPSGWVRVEACRHALFESVKQRGADPTYIGGGILDAGEMLSAATLAKVNKAHQTNALPQAPPDKVSFPLWRLLFGLPPPGPGVDEMYETEAAQIFFRSKNQELADIVADEKHWTQLDPAKRKQLRDDFINEPFMSNRLRRYLQTAAMAAP